jgi:uncharacterized protein YidB (DUF937 family)
MFEDLLKSAIGGQAAPAPDQTQSLLKGAMDLLNGAGGVQGITEKFKQSGLGDLVASWVGTGENKPISAEQLTNVLGPDKVASLAQQAGIPAESGAQALSQVFPALLDKLTPDGVMPDKEQLMTIGKVILGGVGVAAAAKAAASMFGKKGDEAVVADAAAAGAAVAPSVAAAATAVTHTVVSGDTLSKLAKQHLGKANA